MQVPIKIKYREESTVPGEGEVIAEGNPSVTASSSFEPPPGQYAFNSVW